MNTKTTIVIFATVAILAAAIAPSFMNSASAKITTEPTECTNGGGQTPTGQQPECSNTNGLTQETENQNPSGFAPPGQNP